MSETTSGKSEEKIYAKAGDRGFSFLFHDYGLAREPKQGHFGTIVGTGGSGKSVLALQLVTDLLNEEDEKENAVDGKEHENEPRPLAFYFTLEASPQELASQVDQFIWGKQRYRGKKDELLFKEDSEGNYAGKGLHIVSIPSPAESLNALILKIRQSIAKQLNGLKRLVAVIIDPIGAVNIRDDLRLDLIN